MTQPRRKLSPNTPDGLSDWLFDLLAEPIGELGCAGPPDCITCPGGEHVTHLGSYKGVIEVEIDDRIYRIRVEEITR